VLERPARCEASERDAVAPGQHVPQRGAHRVVWWDPQTLDLDREPEAGLRQQRILQADESGAQSSAGEQAHEEWQADRQRAIQDGSTPSLRVRGVSELSKEHAGRAGAGEGAPPPTLPWVATPQSGGAMGESEIAFELTAIRRRGRPRGNRFGTLVHAVLAEVDLDAARADVAAVAEAQARLLAATGEELDAAVDSALAALDHPILRAAAASARRGECAREMPVLLTLPDGAVVEGAVDLAYREQIGGAGVWTVVDFKTDVDPTASRVRYEMQLRLYMQAIEAATGERARAVVLGV
jgi:ATP-dependent exoDNAse (exonuclease V) beta subunit